MSRHWSLLGLGLGLVLNLVGCKQIFGGGGSLVKAEAADVYSGTVLLTLLDANQTAVAFCTGIFVRDGQILTVAHCFDGQKYTKVQVSSYAGALHNNSPTTTNILINPAYDASQPWGARLGKDLAIVKLPAGKGGHMPFPRFATVPPTFPSVATVAGYGATTPGDAATAGTHYIKATRITGMDPSAGNSFVGDLWPAAAGPALPPGFNPSAQAPGMTLPAANNGPGGDAGCPLFNSDRDLIGLSVGLINLGGNEPPNATAGDGTGIRYVSIISDDATAFLGKNLAGIVSSPPSPATSPAQAGGAASGADGKYTDPATGEQRPFCSASVTPDPQSPEWGWEDNQKCRIKT